MLKMQFLYFYLLLTTSTTKYCSAQLYTKKQQQQQQQQRCHKSKLETGYMKVMQYFFSKFEQPKL